MKTGNRIGACVLLLTLLFTLATCGTKAEWTPEALAAGQITEQSAADLLAYLTSPALRGRAVGSDGNVQAAKDIAALFAALGYEPLGEDYLLPYTDELVRQENAGSLLALIAQDGKRIKVLESRLAENPQHAAPGTVLALKPLTIAAENGAVALLTVTPEGGKPMAGTAWAAGRRLKAGDSL